MMMDNEKVAAIQENQIMGIDKAAAGVDISVILQVEELTQVILNAGKILREIFWKIRNVIMQSYDKWQLEKMKISNNKRRHMGIPVVRRRAYLQNIINSRKRMRKK